MQCHSRHGITFGFCCQQRRLGSWLATSIVSMDGYPSKTTSAHLLQCHSVLPVLPDIWSWPGSYIGMANRNNLQADTATGHVWWSAACYFRTCHMRYLCQSFLKLFFFTNSHLFSSNTHKLSFFFAFSALNAVHLMRAWMHIYTLILLC